MPYDKTNNKTSPINSYNHHKVLVAGWFSFKDGHATAGDLLALDVTKKWLNQTSYSNFDVAFDPPFKGGINWRNVESNNYSHVIFVCGPFGKGLLEAQFLHKFRQCRLIGLNLSMTDSIHTWKPFDLLLERNSEENIRADMAFASTEPKVPVVGVCLVESYEGALVEQINEFIYNFVDSKHFSTVYIDTRLDKNSTHLKSKAEIESLIARVDLLITTRLHGTVLALKNGVPVIPIDPEPGGAKIVYQVKKLGWPVIYTAESLSQKEFNDSFRYCLTEKAKRKAQKCFSTALDALSDTKNEFISALEGNDLDATYQNRINSPSKNSWTNDILTKNKDNNRTSVNNNSIVKLKNYLKIIMKNN